MNPKKLLGILFLLLVAIFITSGDTYEFLPKPAREASVKSREFIVGLWPDWLRPRDLDAQREKEIEQLQKGGGK
ncbi:hypothetical protein VB834_13160 [Limnoraphis robusta Tam1]|nr:hypothetical protein [Limnoraphis robusta]MEA5499862.1 hypothetical protein [Limnoraphis robusta BA-68 BA1]MEA5523239.1 hypothetical protein [Limnoraphis robusta CCNP1315]MEA5539979.1 hypothetical protein [Limnoraphis robusta Tam1]MEA5549278.1 hypothetical protein [Limnoraphis robusta CCNP1324]